MSRRGPGRGRRRTTPAVCGRINSRARSDTVGRQPLPDSRPASRCRLGAAKPLAAALGAASTSSPGGRCRRAAGAGACQRARTVALQVEETVYAQGQPRVHSPVRQTSRGNTRGAAARHVRSARGTRRAAPALGRGRLLTGPRLQRGQPPTKALSAHSEHTALPSHDSPTAALSSTCRSCGRSSSIPTALAVATQAL